MDITLPAEKQLIAYNNRDIDAFIPCYAHDVIVEDGQGKVLMTGIEEMRRNYERLFANSPNLHCKLLSRKVVGNYVLDEEHVTGRQGSDKPSHVIAIYLVEDGHIKHVRFLR